MQRYPDIQLDMGVSDRMVDMIGENVDCVVRGGELADQSLKARHVGDLQLGVYAAPGYLERAGTPAHPAGAGRLASPHRGFLVGRAPARPFLLRHAPRRRDASRCSGRYVISVDDGNAYLAAGLAGLGVLWLPDYMSRGTRGARRVGASVPGLAPRSDAARTWRSPPNRHVSAKLRVFIDWIVELMARHAPLRGR